MDSQEESVTTYDSDANLSDDDLAFKQAKERGTLTQDEFAYFEYKGYDCSGIAVQAEEG